MVFFSSLLNRAALEPGYSIQIFQTEQGLPQNNINSIVQSRDGYLWLATFGGLVRFDGVRFKVFDSANTAQLQNNRITALFEDVNGVMWIGHETGDLTRLKDGQFETVKIPGPPHREPVLTITTDERNVLMLFYQSAALRNVETGALIETEISSEPQRGVTSMVRDGSGAIWIMRAGSLYRVINGRSELIQLDRFAADQQVFGIGAARDGGVWIAMAGRLRKRIHDQWTDQISPLPWRQTFIPAMVEMANGVLAVATTDQGIILFRPNESAFRAGRTDGLPPDWVRSMCEDREGNLWAAFGGGGMAALRPARVLPIKSSDRWKGRPVLSVTAMHNNSLWAGTEGAGLYRYIYNNFVPVIADQGPSTNFFIWSFAEDDAGRLWVSAADHGLFVSNGERFQSPAGLEDFSTPIRALFQSPSQHALFMGAHSGLLKYQNQKLETLATNLILPDVRCVAEQTNGVLWFGMFGGGLGKLENGKAIQFRKSDGLSSDFVQCLYVDVEDTLWVGTAESGLNRYKAGHFSSITTAQGLHDNVICHVADDGLGNFWISSHAGIMRVAKADLNRCADGLTKLVQCLSLGETDGLPSAQSSGGLQPTGAKTSDGTLWFATLNGIAAIDPRNVRTNQLPIVLVEEFRLNDAPVAREKSSDRITIQPGRHRFDFDYTAINFAAPDRILFKYRLEGLEPEWVGPTTKRTVSYSQLPPGDFTFRVIASNSDGVWNEANATLAFTLLPFFYQTLWFRILSILVAIGFVGLGALLITRQRYRRQIELAERQRGIERERARIAQDIHDDLGSSLTRIILLSQSARGDLDSPELAATDLDRIYDTARNLTRSLDEIVWAVNPRHDTLDSLATYLGKFAQDFLGAANIRCRLNLPVSVPSWPLSAEVRHNVFLAFKEALNNGVKHAQATEIRISLTLETSAFTLTVEDNGRGFSPGSIAAPDTATEDGLKNMRKRLSEIGGAAEIKSTPSKGASVTFRVPICATGA